MHLDRAIAYIAFDARLAWTALAGAVVLGLAMGIPIAWFSLRGYAADALQSETRGGTAGRAAQAFRHGFIMAQIALAFVLLVGLAACAVPLRRALSISREQLGPRCAGRSSRGCSRRR